MEKKTETVVEKVCSGVADFVEYFTVSFLINYFSFTFFFSFASITGCRVDDRRCWVSQKSYF